MIKRPFEQWLYEDIHKEFGIKRVKNHPLLLDWITVLEAKPLDKNIIRLQNLIENRIEAWNEDELKMNFIAPLLTEINYHFLPHYTVFNQRYFSLQTETIEASGRIEWLVSQGEQTPQHPFFFLQEYKPEKNSGNDPLGQLLIAMVDVQMLNNTPQKPLYGCYTIGRLWFFVVLLGKEYSVSRAYDATQTDDLSAMVIILERVKEYIHQELGLPYP
ncbi:MAG: hypothetical protein NW226_11440 [Microscillaceae bacterium]|nr:hypothetical protein [Microscillaceae bacterium]